MFPAVGNGCASVLSIARIREMRVVDGSIVGPSMLAMGGHPEENPLSNHGELVVSAWMGDCPECSEGGAIFMVRADGDVSFRCPTCRECRRLSEELHWERWEEFDQG